MRPASVVTIPSRCDEVFRVDPDYAQTSGVLLVCVARFEMAPCERVEAGYFQCFVGKDKIRPK